MKDEPDIKILNRSNMFWVRGLHGVGWDIAASKLGGVHSPSSDSGGFPFEDKEGVLRVISKLHPDRKVVEV